MSGSLSGKRALVTGGDSGIGAGVALALAAAGADVAIVYNRNEVAAAEVVKSIEASGVKGLSAQANVADAGDVDRLFETLASEWAPLDILVCSAGIDGHPQLSWEGDPDAWLTVVKVNLFGAYLCARKALAQMVERKSGVVINISSVHEVIPWTGFSAYTASKAGMSMMTKTMAQEVAEHGVRVLAVAPGAIQTPINQNVWGDPVGLKDLLDKIPFGRMGTPEEIGRLVAVLASDDASYVTGTTVFADGGMTLFPSFRHGG
jgi:NAD(P)-dependent dehydrogenase (short-subunit alcohol dehydrogenase family)